MPSLLRNKSESRVHLGIRTAGCLSELESSPGSQAKSQDAECLEQLQKATKEEVDAGFLQGPFHSESEVTKELGTHRWLAIRRFVIKQGQKHRPIDDALEAHLNDAYTSTIRLRLKMEIT